MEYVVVFFAGAIASAAPIIIWYYPRFVRLSKDTKATQALQVRLLSEQNECQAAAASLNAKIVKYDSLVRENTVLKQDLFNLSVQLKKTQSDRLDAAMQQGALDGRTRSLAARYLKDHVRWIADKLTSSNFARCKQQLLGIIADCRELGYEVSPEEETRLVDDLKRNFEEAVRREFQREEQARIKTQIREEERFQREIDKQIQDAERERAAIQAALDKALKEAKDEHSAEVEQWKARLQEAEEKAQRAKSMAQMTKAGHVYVLSNIGSFGEGVYKIGMSRRLEPMDRVRELGDASVPFPFDVHMMISCNDAPSLENSLHREFHKQRLNKVNFRKEFYRVDFDAIRKMVEANHGEVQYTAEPEALQFRESQTMSDADYEFIERTVESVTGDGLGSLAED
jgi:hypothetical protein